MSISATGVPASPPTFGKASFAKPQAALRSDQPPPHQHKPKQSTALDGLLASVASTPAKGKPGSLVDIKA